MPVHDAQVTAPPLDGNQYLLTLESGTAEPIDIARATVQLLAQQFAQAFRSQRLGITQADAIKKALAELRQGEQDDIDLKKQRAELIPRAHVIEILASLIQLMNRGLDAFVNGVALEFGQWLADPALRDAPTDERGRRVREYAEKCVYQTRKLQAESVETLIERKEE